MFCPNCGADLADGAKFCPKCGTKIDKEQPNQPRQQAPADSAPKKETPSPRGTDRSNLKSQGNDTVAQDKKNLIPRNIGIAIAVVVVIAVIIVVLAVSLSNKDDDSIESVKETAVTSSESAEVSESATVSSETTPTTEKTQQTTDSGTDNGIIKTTVDGYVTTMDEIPEEFFAQCENKGKSGVLENQDSVCFDYNTLEYVEVKDIDSINCVYWYFVTRDEPSGKGNSYFSQQARNALGFLYEFKGTTRFSEKSATGWCFVIFQDIIGNNGILEYEHASISDAGSTDLNPAKSALENTLTSFDFKIAGNPAMYPDYT